MTDAAFSAEYAAGFAPMLRYARQSRLSDPENMAQWAWARAWEKREQFRGDSSFRTWVYSILLNRICEERRRPARVIFVDKSPELPVMPTVESTIDAWKLLEQVSPDQRRVLQLFHLAGMSFAEMAEMTGRPENTLKTLAFRGRHRAAEFARLSA